ncbi:hypothetical protein KDRO_C00770 [Kluyveromyces lactis]|nr:hypothetical protein KDRO_C00770 [Kluyveromyces lactis]
MMSRRLHSLAKKDIVDLAYSHIGGKFAGNHLHPAIITLHGVFGAKAHFKPLAKRLASDLKTDIYSVDLRNHGDSPMAKPYDYITLSKDIVHFIKTQVGAERPVQMIGFSLGGKVSLISTLSDECNIRGCVSIDIPPYETPVLDPILLENYDTILKIINGEDGYVIKKGETNWKHKVLNIFKANKCNWNEGLSRYFAAGFVMNPINHFVKDEFLEFKQPLKLMPDLLDELKAWPEKDAFGANGFNYQTQKPVLFCKALKSPFISSDYSLLYKQYPNCTVEEFNTSHNIAHEAADHFYESITSFFKRCE